MLINMLMNTLMNMLMNEYVYEVAMLMNMFMNEYVYEIGDEYVDECVDEVGNVDDYCVCALTVCALTVHIQQYSRDTYKHNPLSGHPSTSLPHMCSGTNYYRMHTVSICGLGHSHSYRQHS